MRRRTPEQCDKPRACEFISTIVKLGLPQFREYLLARAHLEARVAPVVGVEKVGRFEVVNLGRGELLDHELGQDGTQSELIQIVSGGSRRPASAETVAAREHFLRMQGREVFRFAVSKITELVELILSRNGLGLDDLALLVPHQANQRILDAAARALGLPMERVVSNVERYGNTSNASIPLALDEAVRAGRLREGDHVVLVAFGGGLTWGASLVRW